MKKSLTLGDTVRGVCACLNRLDECLWRLSHLQFTDKDMKIKGQILNGSNISVQLYLQLSDVLLQFRSVCTHAVALYILKKDL